MRSVNKVILIGNITRDPNLRQTPSGQAVSTFGVATNRQWMTKGSDKHASTEFHEVVAWAKLAELADHHLRKGKLVYIEGYLSTRSWETPEGTKKFKTEIVAQDIIILSRREDAGSAPIHEREPVRETQSVHEEAVKKDEPIPMEAPAEAPAETPAQAPADEQDMPVTAGNEKDNLIDRDLGL